MDLLLKSVDKLQFLIESACFGPALWEDVSKVAKQCDDLHKEISDCVPTMKPRLHEFTDAGPGVGFQTRM